MRFFVWRWLVIMLGASSLEIGLLMTITVPDSIAQLFAFARLATDEDSDESAHFGDIGLFLWPNTVFRMRTSMTKKIDRYTYRVAWSEEDQEHIGLCVEFPSLSWLDGSQEKALVGVRKLVANTVVDLKRNKEPVAEPASDASDWGSQGDV